MSEHGILVILSGPSGVGKTTVIEHLCRTDRFTESVSATTRKPRGDELDGVHYHFLSSEEFERRVLAGEFLEHAVVHGERYGTLLAEVDRIRRSGRHCIMSIDVQGAQQIRDKGVPALLLFLVPPSMAVLEQRLRDRETDSEQEIRSRLRTAREEMKWSDRYDRVIVNDVAEEAAREVREAVEELRDTVEEA